MNPRKMFLRATPQMVHFVLVKFFLPPVHHTTSPPSNTGEKKKKWGNPGVFKEITSIYTEKYFKGTPRG